jgi:YggT family protein
MIKALIFLIETFSALYLVILLLRFWLPILRANFQNQIAQGVLKYSSPAVVPLRRFIPPIGRLDTATVIVAFVIQFLALLTTTALSLQGFTDLPPLWTLAVVSVFRLMSLSVTLFIVTIIIRVILNLLGKYLGPISDMLVDLTEPVMRPVRKIIPPLGVVDLSAYITIILLIALNMVLSDLQFQVLRLS